MIIAPGPKLSMQDSFSTIGKTSPTKDSERRHFHLNICMVYSPVRLRKLDSLQRNRKKNQSCREVTSQEEFIKGSHENENVLRWASVKRELLKTVRKRQVPVLGQP